ncbi:hypothetical protein PTKIN_Ptkin11bG0175900 [Pterospermum kingtungense]
MELGRNLTSSSNPKRSVGAEGLRSSSSGGSKISPNELGHSNGVEGGLDFKGLFASSPLMARSLSFFPPILEEEEELAEPPTAVIEDGEARWKDAVVVQVLGKIPNFSYFCKVINLLWGTEGEIEVRPAMENLFLVNFPNSKVGDNVLENGPWHIQNRPLLIRKWDLV